MSTMTLYESSGVTLWYHPETKIVHHQIHRFVCGEELQIFLLIGSDAIRRGRAKKWLSDERANAMVRKEDMEWEVANWLPLTVRAGWKYLAIVRSEKTISQMDMTQLAKDYSKAGVEARFFSDPDEALKWLESQ